MAEPNETAAPKGSTSPDGEALVLKAFKMHPAEAAAVARDLVDAERDARAATDEVVDAVDVELQVAARLLQGGGDARRRGAQRDDPVGVDRDRHAPPSRRGPEVVEGQPINRSGSRSSSL